MYIIVWSSGFFSGKNYLRSNVNYWLKSAVFYGRNSFQVVNKFLESLGFGHFWGKVSNDSTDTQPNFRAALSLVERLVEGQTLCCTVVRLYSFT